MNKETQVFILTLLTILNEKFCTQSANLKVHEDGRLILWIIAPDGLWRSVIFDEEYEDIICQDLATSIIKMLTAKN